MKGKRVIAGILLAGILAVTLAGCKNTDNTKEETEKPVITLGSDNYPPYNYLNEDGVPTGIDVELAQRIIDFTSGSCFAISGNLQKISHYIFIITPASVDISGDFQDIFGGAGSFEMPINNGMS